MGELGVGGCGVLESLSIQNNVCLFMVKLGLTTSFEL